MSGSFMFLGFGSGASAVQEGTGTIPVWQKSTLQSTNSVPIQRAALLNQRSGTRAVRTLVMLAVFCPNRNNYGRVLSTPSVDQIGLESSKVGQGQPWHKFGRPWPEIGRIRPNSARHWPPLSRIWATRGGGTNVFLERFLSSVVKMPRTFKVQVQCSFSRVPVQ